ncbi:HNH endonuclease [Actinobacillus pleuropneumoniae]|uniref:HNH endonuclease n=2 Tax=Actinobacillus pleuropneumoniae TaxID=715 RepID=B4XH92_ACTPL|nr:HNH endonuclease signature motif containing protein [Actinobacillus pleuropneumoniae]ABV82724.1 hypothetical protein [Actinobacillus pleuropneumoniae]AWG95622.1 HNH endonuclease [Actinobacillus pleuropneumoniae serovar 1 str. 4074]AXA21692.1 HNH endonuclease [Actinobacillus pleuropneumoniae]EFM93936.1 hypothetical protein appser9_13210 [Actinobacillus pleuropneumoniae serovar 9 str. CVJ13261]EFM98323.1 hypothetical protein appser11_13210 [Actinobacillus pleuropneumoniae serovar 11 str. 5615
MKLSVDFRALFTAVKKMGVEKITPISLLPTNQAIKTDFEVQINSRSGFEVSNIEDVEVKFGVFTYNGWHVLLFIPDHSYGSTFDRTIEDSSQGNKYHLTDCSTLENMRQRGRFQRYHATNNTEGIFTIFDAYGREAEVALHACKNCLRQLGYYPYNTFNLVGFFEKYDSHFCNLPKAINQDKAGYHQDWENISRQYRESHQYCCEQCGVNLTSHKHLLDVHHKNGVKQDNRKDNLIALCKICHSEQDSHGHYYVSLMDRQIIESLRSPF